MAARDRSELPSRDVLAWRVYQIEDLLHQAESVVDEGMRVLRNAHDKGPDDRFRIRPQRIEDLRRVVDELGELAEQAQSFVEPLPRHEIHVTREGAAAEALRELREGAIYDGKRVLLVGQMASRSEGLRALASGLRASDAYESWQGLAFKDLFKAFDRMTPQLIRLIVTDVGLTPGDGIALCAPAEINRLAGRIDDYVNKGT